VQLSRLVVGIKPTFVCSHLLGSCQSTCVDKNNYIQNSNIDQLFWLSRSTYSFTTAAVLVWTLHLSPCHRFILVGDTANPQWTQAILGGVIPLFQAICDPTLWQLLAVYCSEK
jgi:hypothetical protein